MATRAKQRYFNELAPRWDTLPAPDGAADKVRAFAQRAAAPGCRQILDLGCGTGILLLTLLERSPEALITEVDLAEEMLRANTAKLCDARVRRVCADGSRLPFRAAAFDLVLCFGVLPHFEDLGGALGELARVLGPGGVLAVGHVMGSAELNAFHRSLGDPVAGDVLPPSSELAEKLNRVGLVTAEAEEAPGWYFVRAEKPR